MRGDRVVGRNTLSEASCRQMIDVMLAAKHGITTSITPRGVTIGRETGVTFGYELTGQRFFQHLDRAGDVQQRLAQLRCLAVELREPGLASLESPAQLAQSNLDLALAHRTCHCVTPIAPE